MAEKITFAVVRSELKAVGVVVKANEWNEYEVNVKGARDSSTYHVDRGHTRDDQRAALEDALMTGRAMAAREEMKLRKAG